MAAIKYDPLLDAKTMKTLVFFVVAMVGVYYMRSHEDTGENSHINMAAALFASVMAATWGLGFFKSMAIGVVMYIFLAYAVKPGGGIDPESQLGVASTL